MMNTKFDNSSVNTTTESSPQMMIFHSAFVATAVFCLISTILISIGNFTLVYAIFKNPRKDLRTPSSLLFINLCVSDFFTGFLLGSMMTADSFMDVFSQNSFLLDALVFVVGSLFLFVNNLTIGAISVDRLLAVSLPLQYKSLVTVGRIKVSIFIIWLLAFVICLLPLFGVPRNVFLLLYSHSHVSVPLVFLTTMYAFIFRNLARQRKELRRLQQSNGETMNTSDKMRERRRMERDRHLTTTVVLVMLTFSISSLPFLICVHLAVNMENCTSDCISYYWERTITSFYYFSGRFVLLNALLDPLLVVWRMPKMREAVRLTTVFGKFISDKSRGRIHPAATMTQLPSILEVRANTEVTSSENGRK